MGLVAAAVTEELRKPPRRRHWHGRIARLVPYDLRPPTLARVRASLWDPKGAFFTPPAFGVGWSLNLGRLARRLGLR